MVARDSKIWHIAFCDGQQYSIFVQVEITEKTSPTFALHEWMPLRAPDAVNPTILFQVLTTPKNCSLAEKHVSSKLPMQFNGLFVTTCVCQVQVFDQSALCPGFALQHLIAVIRHHHRAS